MAKMKKALVSEASAQTLKVRIAYKHIDGAHFFVGEDKLAAGLCVAHKNFAEAYKEVSHQLRLLLKHNHGIDADVNPAMSFEAFQLAVDASRSANETHGGRGVIELAAIQPWMVGEGRRAQ